MHKGPNDPEQQSVSEWPVARKIEYTYHGPESVLHSFAHAAMARQTNSSLELPHNWLIVPGGGTRGAIQAGVMQAAVETGIVYGANNAIGLSVGAAVLVESMARNRESSRIFHEDNLRNRFVSRNPMDWIRGRGINFQGLDESFRVTHPLDKEVLAACPFPLWVGVMPNTGPDAGKIKYIDARRATDPIGVMMASMLIPWLGNIKSVSIEIDGQMYSCNDGGIPDPLGIASAIEGGADNILLIMNEPMTEKTWYDFLNAELKHLVGKVGRRNPVWQEVFSLPKRYNATLQRIQEGAIYLDDGRMVTIGMIAPTEKSVKFLDSNWALQRRAVADGMEAGNTLFTKILESVRSEDRPAA